MSVKTMEQSQVVASAIREISHIATLPEITIRIIELVEAPSSTAQDLHKVISNDPALCSRILKVVNSSFYGLPGQIGSINRALVLLGLNAVKNIAISASLAKLFKGGQICPQFAAKDLWSHSVATATGAKLVASELGMGAADEAFLAGLIHDIGIMVELQFDRNKFIEVFNGLAVGPNGTPQNNLLDVESRVFGANHQQFGMALSEKWKFPKAFGAVCGHHHNPMELPAGTRTLACLVHVAEALAAGLDKGFRMETVTNQIIPAVLDELSLSPSKLPELEKKLADSLGDVEAVLTA
ncbi:MAG: HDOD domain-containing protein [Phycisphaerales bacterium]|nr:HDOD domain-containing protein [Phycisphaerales bacterium]